MGKLWKLLNNIACAYRNRVILRDENRSIFYQEEWSQFITMDKGGA